jgi:hypothetical protein
VRQQTVIGAVAVAAPVGAGTDGAQLPVGLASNTSEDSSRKPSAAQRSPTASTSLAIPCFRRPRPFPELVRLVLGDEHVPSPRNVVQLSKHESYGRVRRAFDPNSCFSRV